MLNIKHVLLPEMGSVVQKMPAKYEEAAGPQQPQKTVAARDKLTTVSRKIDGTVFNGSGGWAYQQHRAPKV